jgi:FkbM family methyltransferase
MFAGRDIESIAFDSDLASLAATKRLCQFAPGKLRLVHGYVVDRGCGLTLENATVSAPVYGAPIYRNFDTPDAAIPCNALDDLFSRYPDVGRSVLLKSDIEGAELFMLRGARDFMARHKPTLLISVHHWHLQQFGHCANSVRQLIEGLGYSVTLLATDHEEHWLCRHPDLSRM